VGDTTNHVLEPIGSCVRAGFVGHDGLVWFACRLCHQGCIASVCDVSRIGLCCDLCKFCCGVGLVCCFWVWIFWGSFSDFLVVSGRLVLSFPYISIPPVPCVSLYFICRLVYSSLFIDFICHLKILKSEATYVIHIYIFFTTF